MQGCITGGQDEDHGIIIPKYNYGRWTVKNANRKTIVHLKYGVGGVLNALDAMDHHKNRQMGSRLKQEWG